MMKIETRGEKMYYEADGGTYDIAKELCCILNFFIQDRLLHECEAEILADMVAQAIKVDRKIAFDWDKFLSELDRRRKETEESSND